MYYNTNNTLKQNNWDQGENTDFQDSDKRNSVKWTWQAPEGTLTGAIAYPEAKQ